MLLAGCGNEPFPEEKPGQAKNSWMQENQDNFVPGTIRIKLSPASREKISLSPEGIRIPALDKLASGWKIRQIRRVFPPAGTFEARHIAAGLDLWYDIEFGPKTPLTRAAADLDRTDGISIVEPIRRIKKTGNERFIPLPARPERVRPSGTAGFNDPLLPQQWHYENDGSLPDAKAGADIHLKAAWPVSTGSRKVIVAVIDGGIDYNHEDLRENMWENEQKEGPYASAVHGWNFTDNSATIVPMAHGTHVAGTIGAVNNNGIGVCGIAGGSRNGDGIRLMSCQIFAPDPSDPEKELSGDAPKATVFAADHGAVICNNSWEYVFEAGTDPVMPASEQQAIDYFIEHAGTDAAGRQTGPMKGGIVIFAAGNSNVDYKSYPPQYEKVIAVASMAPDFTKAHYSNYADWVDITAPGGSVRNNGKFNDKCQVLSTLPDNQYGWMQGTSMACPHVSGIAALIVSKYGADQNGLTPEDVKKRLLYTAKDIERYNSRFEGKLGSGCADAAAALQENTQTPPAAVNDLKASWNSTGVELSWSVTANAENIPADHYDLYISPRPFEGEDFSHLEAQRVENGGKKAGEMLTALISGLESETAYYIAVVGSDIFGNRSAAAFLNGRTQANQPPSVQRRNTDDIILKAHETRKEYFDVSEPEHQTYRFTLDAREGMSAKQEGNAITVIIRAPAISNGAAETGVGILTVTDEKGAATVTEIPFRILPNHAPENTPETLEDLYFKQIGDSHSIRPETYFTDSDGERLAYKVSCSLPGLIRSSQSNGQLVITSLKNGQGTVTITATDYFQASCSRSFTVRSGDSKQDPGLYPNLYPNPVKELLNISMGENVTGKIEVRLYGDSGIEVWKSVETVSPSQPAQLNLSGLPGGNYSVVVTYEGKKYKNNIVKW